MPPNDWSGDPPAAVFQTLSHPIRTRVLTALGNADAGLTYERLRERVGVRDNGKFNYHLGELRDRFVENRGDRYRLTPTGRHAVECVVGGTLGTERPTRTFGTDSACQKCGSHLTATYDGATFRLDCPACGCCHRSVRFPPRGVSMRDDGALLDAVDTAVRQTLSSLGERVCPRCRATVTVAATTDGWGRGDGPRSLTFGFEHHCPACGGDWTATVGELVLDHPAVAAFYHDHGIDVRAVHTWELEFAATDHDTRVRSRDPLTLELRPQFGNDELVLVVDSEGTVRRSSRHTKFTARETRFDRPVES